jgi:glucosamine 6-phosphate synthetase-like amidotransferase/phosphosugar isomerase protein
MEITYIHGRGQPSCEMKHGPIALIEPIPDLALALRDALFPKVEDQPGGGPVADGASWP